MTLVGLIDQPVDLKNMHLLVFDHSEKDRRCTNNTKMWKKSIVNYVHKELESEAASVDI